jgi:hypothetical protein
MKAILFVATIFLAACAGTTPATIDPKVIEPSPHEGAATSEQSAADRRFAEEARGYKQVEKNGRMVYCRTERPLGSNLRTQNCYSEAELRARAESAEANRQRKKTAMCQANDPRCAGD